MRTYFLQYEEDTSINYLYLLLLYRIAEVGKTTRLFDTVRYSSFDELTTRLNAEYKKINPTYSKAVVSKTTLSRVLHSDEKQQYFIFDKAQKLIILQNNFSKQKTNGHAKFITLTDRELDFLLIQNTPLLYRYYFFMKYKCGFSGVNKTDFTAKQFLEASNYSTKAGNYISLLSQFNSLLSTEGFISISKFIFNGHERNCYSIL